MTKSYQRGNQKPSIEEQTIQWPKDIKEVIRSRQSKNRQYNGQKIHKRYRLKKHINQCFQVKTVERDVFLLFRVEMIYFITPDSNDAYYHYNIV